MVVAQRMLNQRLSGQQFEQPEEVVRWLGAVQSQEFLGAKWALALRMQVAEDTAIEQAFADGKILRTHIMRPTWHFVMPDDIRWIQMLTAPRVHAFNAYMYRQSELDDSLLVQGTDVIAAALRDGRQLTRVELGVALAEAGIIADGVRLGYLIHYAELEAMVCSGGRRGKQFTYALVDERAPNARILNRDEALAELTIRYYTSHGAASVHDFAWWSGLTIADVKAGIEMVKSELSSKTINEQTYWFNSTSPPTPPRIHGGEKSRNTQHSETSASAKPMTAYLLPTYDEYVIGYTDRSLMFDQSEIRVPGSRRETAFDSMILIDGVVVGTWRREFKKGAVVIETEFIKPLRDDEQAAFVAATARYGEYWGMPVVIN